MSGLRKRALLVFRFQRYKVARCWVLSIKTHRFARCQNILGFPSGTELGRVAVALLHGQSFATGSCRPQFRRGPAVQYYGQHLRIFWLPLPACSLFFFSIRFRLTPTSTSTGPQIDPPLTDADLLVHKLPTTNINAFDSQDESMPVGSYADARFQGAKSGASRGEEICHIDVGGVSNILSPSATFRSRAVASPCALLLAIFASPSRLSPTSTP